MGAIASKVDEEFDFLPKEPELESICKGCEYRRNHTDNDADQSKVIRGNVSTDGVADGAERVKCDDEKLVHGGIIAFLKRIFGR